MTIIQENMDSSAEASFSSHNRYSPGNQSAPIFFDRKFDTPEKINELRPSSTKKFHTYVLPTPVDGKRPIATCSVSPPSTARPVHRSAASVQLWHSSPLEPYKFAKNYRNNESSSLTKFPKVDTTVLKESNINSGPVRMPPPLSEPLSMPHFNQQPGVDTRDMRHQSFSGPLTSRHWSNNPNVSATDHIPSLERPHTASMMPLPVLTSRPSISPKGTPKISPPAIRSPMISELHELPRPPVGSTRSTRPASLIGYSAPLLYRGPELNKTTKTSPIAAHAASPLPTPPAGVQRSFSIPTTRRPVSPVAKFLDDPHNTSLAEDVASPHLTPISLTKTLPAL